MASTSVHASWFQIENGKYKLLPEPEGASDGGERAGERQRGCWQGGAASWARAIERFPSADRVLSTILTRQAEQYGDRVLFVSGETRWTYRRPSRLRRLRRSFSPMPASGPAIGWR